MGWLTAAMAGGCRCAAGGCVPREEATEGVFSGPKPRSPSSRHGLLSSLHLVLLVKGDQGRRENQTPQKALCQNCEGLWGPSLWQHVLTLVSPTLSLSVASLVSSVPANSVVMNPKFIVRGNYIITLGSLACREYNIIAKINVIATVRSAPEGQ